MSVESQYQLLQRRDWFSLLYRREDGRLVGWGVVEGRQTGIVIDEPISKRMAYLIGDLQIPPRVYMVDL